MLCKCGCGKEAGSSRGRQFEYVQYHGHRGKYRKITEADWTLDSNGCWNWNGAVTNCGYGKCADRGRTGLAHRVSYEQFVGKIPDGLQIDHLCRNKLCVNPDHMEVVTAAVNTQRSGNAKLTREKVVEMRESASSFKSRWAAARHYAKEIGMHPVIVHYAITGRTWRDVPLHGER